MAWPSHLVAPDLLLLQCGALDGIDEITRNKLLIEPVAANKDENTRPNIPFEACVLIALVSLGGTAPMEKLLMRVSQGAEDTRAACKYMILIANTQIDHAPVPILG